MEYCIGVFGSAFDPPTLGHKDVIEQAAMVCDEIILVPCIRHAFQKKTLSFTQRLLLINVFLAALSDVDCKVVVSTIEKELLEMAPGQPVYTYDLMNALEQRLIGEGKGKKLIFIRGPDNAESVTWSRFYRYRDIEQRWDLFTAKDRVSVRSSAVRALLKNASYFDKSIDQEGRLSKYLSPGVLHCILVNNFYRDGSIHHG